MIDYSTLSPMQHMFVMRLILGGIPDGISLKIRAAVGNEIWVDYRFGRQDDEGLSRLAKKCGLTEIENHHYSIPT